MISQSELQKLFKYNKETGDFIRKVKTAIATSVGEKAGYKNKQGYVQMRIQGKTYQAHALAWLYMFGEIPTLIDHIDGNRSNNAITNLRIADRSINGFNREKKSESSSVFKGVGNQRSTPAESESTLGIFIPSKRPDMLTTNPRLNCTENMRDLIRLE